MRLEWLEDILAVAETGSFSEAAERRHLTQSAFSRRIRTIEESLGVSLFDRSRKPAVLNAATLDQSDRIAQSAHALRQLIFELQSGEKRSVKRIILASQHALTTSFTPALLQRILAGDPDISVRLRSGNLDDCYSLIISRKADIALVYRAAAEGLPFDTTNLEAVDLGQERLIPVVSAKAWDLMKEMAKTGPLPVIAYPNDVFLGRLTAHHIWPRLPQTQRVVPRVETALTLAALELAGKGIGVAWVPASLAAGGIAAGGLADLSGQLPDCDLTISAVRIKGQTGPAAAILWDMLATKGGAFPDAKAEAKKD